VGTADRVGSGTDTRLLGYSTFYPGYISSAGVLNQKLTPEEIVYLHAALSSSSFDMNAASIAACARGTYGSQIPGMGLTCTACPAGYTTAGAGTAGPDASACTVCAAGYSGTSYSGESGCTACAQGKYGSTLAGNGNTCTSCGAGYSTASSATIGTDSAACTVCAAGCSGTSTAGISGCIKCPQGKYGSATSGNGNVCLYCPEGKYSGAEGAAECITSEIGQYVSSYVPRYIRIDQLQYPVDNNPNQHILNLAELTLWNNGVALNMLGTPVFISSIQYDWRPAANLVDGNLNNMIHTSYNPIWDPDPWVYVEVGARSFDQVVITNVDVFIRINGARISFVADVNGAVPLAARQYFPSTGATTFTFAFPEGIGALGGSAVSSCPEGYTTSGAGSSSVAACNICAAGYWLAENGNTCTPCKMGYSTAAAGTSGTDASACTVCAAGYIGSTSNGTSGCTECDTGEYSAANATECTACAAGKYNPGKGQAACFLCGSGTSSDAIGAESSETCIKCPSGYWSSPGAATCTRCSPGHVAGERSSACQACSAGSCATFDQDSCNYCPAGKYSADAASACTDCAPGYVSVGFASQCTMCSAGTYASARAAFCAVCPKNTFSGDGASQCTACAAGTSSKERSSECDSCYPSMAPTLAPTAAPTTAPVCAWVLRVSNYGCCEGGNASGFMGTGVGLAACQAYCISEAAAAGERCGAVFGALGSGDMSCWWCDSSFTACSPAHSIYQRYDYVCA